MQTQIENTGQNEKESEKKDSEQIIYNLDLPLIDVEKEDDFHSYSYYTNSYNNWYKGFFAAIIIFLISYSTSFSQTSTIEQKLSVLQNSGTNGGVFSVEYQIKGTNLTTAATLASLNADIVYDSAIVRFVNGTNWQGKIDEANGYSSSIQSNNTEAGNYKAVRIVVVAPTLNEDGSAGVTGYDLKSNYETIVQLNFIILDNTKRATLTVKSITNQVGLFLNPANNPNSFDITNKNLSNPINIQDEPMPVMLASFISNVNGRNVKLSWVTSSEINNKGFEIERAESGSPNTFTEVSFINGANNSNMPKQYSYTDTKLNSGKYTYRLKQTDNNGNYQYYSLNSSVDVALPSKINISQNYPKPFNPVTKIDYEVPVDSKVSVKIYDMTGKEVSTLLSTENHKAGFYTLQFDASKLSSGTYIYRFIAENTTNTFTESKKMTVIK